jgi:hypothetical protein
MSDRSESEVVQTPTRVGHCKADPFDVYIGRGAGGRDMLETPIGKRGWLGNPHSVDDYGREGSIERFRKAFEHRLETDDEFRARVRDLAGKRLGCWCQRLDEDEPACHGEVIAEHADRLAREGELVTDGGSDQSEAALNHPSERMEFEYPKSQAFKLASQADPDEYWYVKARVWNYDTDLDGGALPPAKFYKQYQIGEVSSLGGNTRLVYEADLDQHYEPVDKETAQEVV